MYESYSTADEIEARHRAAGRDPKLGYDNYDRDLTGTQRGRLPGRGPRPVLRLRMPDQTSPSTTWSAARSPSRPGSVPDFVLVRGDGDPLYTLANPVDDALMGITHVLRGEDLLSVHAAADRAVRGAGRIGIGAGRVPQFGHLPLVTGEGNRKLSKRDPQSNLFHYRDRGFIPEGLLNYLALLGWSIGASDRDVFTLAEMVAAFDVARVSGNPARFDLKKAEAINAAHICGLLAARRLRAAAEPYLVAELAVTTPVMSDPRAGAAVPARRRARWCRSAARCCPRPRGMLRFLFVDDGASRLDPAAAAKDARRRTPPPVLDAAIERPRCAARTGPRRRSRRPSRRRWSTGSGSSRARRSRRPGGRDRAGRSPRRCTSRWSCSAASGRWDG